MKKNLNIVLKYYNNEQGFAMPIAVGLGLIILLIGTMLLVRSQSDQVSASTQKSNSRGLSAAEIGITRVQSLITSNPVIATYPLTAATGPSWSNASSIPGIGCSSTVNQQVSSFASTYTNWQDVSTPDSSKVQFKIVNYQYSPSDITQPNTAPGTATLTVEGRVDQSGSGNSATSTVGTATTQLQVNIPVQPGSVISTPFPGLWVTSTTASGNTNANILAPCDQTSVPVTFTPPSSNPNNYQVYRNNLNQPQVPNKPSSLIKTITTVAGVTLPQATDITNQLNFNSATGEYQYSIPSISLTGNNVLTFSPGYKVALYVDGNINLGGTTGIRHDCTDTNGNAISNCRPTDARIYGLSANGSLQLSGNAAICDVFFLAPNYTASINGGGNAGSCNSGANSNGIYWIKAWTGGTSGNHISIQQTSANWKDVSFLIPYLPQIAPISTWQRQEASP